MIFDCDFLLLRLEAETGFSSVIFTGDGSSSDQAKFLALLPLFAGRATVSFELEHPMIDENRELYR